MFARFRTPLFFTLLGWLFLVASRGAYRGYFAGDDLDNLAWTRSVGWSTFLTGLLSPQFYVTNFRPLGHLYWWAMQTAAGWDFRGYVAVLHAFHLLNVILLWRLVRRVGAGWAPAACGAIFFAFHIAVFDAYWKPMYIFDVLCATFTLLAILAWLGDRIWWSLAAFWCAYKCKELAIALPVVLLAYEYLLGQRRWKPLLPFFAVSLWFGTQAVLHGGGAGGEYALRLTPATLLHALDFYASQILLAPHLGFALLLIPLLFRDRRVWWGIAALCLFLAPMLLVPGRLFSAYLYLPLTGLAVALAAIADRYSWRWVAAALLLWLPFNYVRMRELRNITLAQAAETKRYVGSIRDFAEQRPDLRTFVLDGEPPHLMAWGVLGTLRLAFGTDAVRTADIATLNTGEDNSDVALLQWDRVEQKLYPALRRSDQRDASRIDMARFTPVWQLDRGWYVRDGHYRWTEPYASAHLWRPQGTHRFDVTVNIGPDYIREVGQVTMEVKVGGVSAGRETFTREGWQTAHFPLPSAPAGTARIEFVVTPPLRPANGDPRLLGIPIGSFGFHE